MGLLDTFDKPGVLQYLGHIAGTMGRPGGPDIGGAIAAAQAAKDRQGSEQQYRGLLEDMSSAAQPSGPQMSMGGGVTAQPITHQRPQLTPQQSGILKMLPPEQGIGLLAERAFAPEPERNIIKGADGYQYYADTGERVLPNIEASAGGNEFEYGRFNPRDYTAESFAEFVRTKDPRVLERFKRYKRFGGMIYDMSGDEPPRPVADVTGALESGKAAETEGTKVGEARSELPQAEVDRDLALKTIKDLRSHPGRVHGWGARVPDWAVDPNSPEMAFRKMHEQAAGQVFLNAYQRLKGGGHITEVETEQAGKALSRLDRATSREEYNKALADLEGAIKRGFAALKRKARLGQRAEPGPAENTGPRPGMEEDGYRFKGGDPSDPNNWEPVE